MVEAYRSEGFAFCERAFNEPDFLVNLTGLSAMNDAVADVDMEWDDEEDEFGDEGEGEDEGEGAGAEGAAAAGGGADAMEGTADAGVDDF